MATYPAINEYNDAIQNPRIAFVDPVLKTGKVNSNTFGIPIALGGGFALTYTIDANGKKFAVRCFHKTADGLEKRYGEINNTPPFTGASYFASFEFQPTGIHVNGAPYPIVKMDWVEGKTLGTYLEAHHTDGTALSKLRGDLQALEEYLRQESIAHGDLQNGNLIIGSDIRLIDYDGVYVPGLQSEKGNELGHRHFQHPKRTAIHFGPDMDRFSFIVLDLSLRALIERPALFQQYSNGENILFTANDYADPINSTAFSDLRTIASISRDVDNLAAICVSSVEKIPTLKDYLAGQKIPASNISLSYPSAVADTITPTGYIGAYDTLDASDYAAVQECVGSRIELIGQITNVMQANTRYGKPFVFINFGDWTERTTKINIWSEGLEKLSIKPTAAWEGKWISVTGLVDPPYTHPRHKYTHLSITITEGNQLRTIDAIEAQRRLQGRIFSLGVDISNQKVLETISARKKPKRNKRKKPVTVASKSKSTNKAILAQIRGSSPVSAPASTKSRGTTSPQSKSSPNQSGVPPWLWWVGGVLVLWFLLS
jgi:hypothetical protein